VDRTYSALWIERIQQMAGILSCRVGTTIGLLGRRESLPSLLATLRVGLFGFQLAFYVAFKEGQRTCIAYGFVTCFYLYSAG